MKYVCLFVVLWLGAGRLAAQSGYQPAPENLRSREAFQDSRFGMFIHWGIYSMLGDGEWAMTNKNIDCREYAKLAGGFYPSKFDAKAWGQAAKDAGMKYICITSRHHDGFSMFGTRYSDYNIVEATPYGRDVVRELAKECRKQGIRLHFYYSLLDWTREDYYPLGTTGQGTGRTAHGDWNDYLGFMNNQLTELLTGYGPVGAVWFDGWWDKADADWQLDKIYATIHRLQPGCLVGNNHHREPFPGEDFQAFEQDLPGQNTAGHSAGQTISALPLETCATMNGTWGYSITDRNYKSVAALIHLLVNAAGRNANLLLNVGPQPDGEIPQASLERLREVGRWMKTYGETVYGTRAGEIAPGAWGVSTRKGDRLFVHVLRRDGDTLSLPLTGGVVRSAVRFADRAEVPFSVATDSVSLDLSGIPADEIDSVIELSVRR